MDFYQALYNIVDEIEDLNMDKRYFIELVFGERDEDISWRDIGDAIADYVFQRAFIAGNESNMMYLDSFEKGFALSSLAISFENFDDDATIEDIQKAYKGFASDIVIKGKGPWCIWDEEMIFYKTIEDAIDRWLGDKSHFSIEPSPEEGQSMVDATSYDKIEILAKTISTTDKKPFKTVSDLAKATHGTK